MTDIKPPMTPKEAEDEMAENFRKWLDTSGIPFEESHMEPRGLSISGTEPISSKRNVVNVGRKYGYIVTKWESRIHLTMDTGLRRGMYECTECDEHFTQAPNQSNFCPSCGSSMYEPL